MIQSRGRKNSSGRNKNINQNLEDLKDKQKEFHHYDQTPEFLSGGTLHPYQLDDLNFLRYAWMKKTHVILADEMGLGKMIQSIAFLASLFEENLTPHIVVAPLSTLRNWECEFATWAPEMNVIMYSGSASARAIARQFEFYYSKEIVDEGHRLKNKDSKLFLQLKLYSTKHRVLLTGTPLQNNLDELFMLMHFLDNGKVICILIRVPSTKEILLKFLWKV